MALPSNPQHTIVVETANVNRENLSGALAAVRGCWKSSSLLWMHVNGFPTLPGVVLGNWSQESEEAVMRFCKERNFSELLVRIEKAGQRWTRRRAGYTISLGEVHKLVQTLTREGMLTILLEPASPYMDGFSLTSVCDVDTGKVDLEVVGAGFDASDILRGDITPHERFEVSLDSGAVALLDHPNFRATRTHAVDRESYRATVRRRLVKIGARLRNPSFPDEQMPPSAAASGMDALAREATRYLRESGQTALLDHLDQYEPIREPLMKVFLDELYRLFGMIKTSRSHWRTLSLAASFLSADRLVIWDFFSPDNYDTELLLKTGPSAARAM